MPDHRKFNRRPRTERIAEICRAARVAFAENGYEGAVIADIAAAAGIAEGTIYKLFCTPSSRIGTVRSLPISTVSSPVSMTRRRSCAF